MFLNVSLSAGGPADTTAPRTPEILNSLISLTSPPLPPSYAHYQGGTAELLSPDCSTPGDECGGGGWGGVGDSGSLGVESGSMTPLHNQHNQYSPSLSSTPLHNHNHLHNHQQHQMLYPSSSLLTPTSEGSPPPLLTVPPHSLPSPVSTVEATRSALIKEGLKLQITSKLQQHAAGAVGAAAAADLLLSQSTVIKTELTPEDEERRRRRRERNKVAATKCRNKKKEMTEILVSESESVEDVNIRLKGEVQRLRVEKDRLEKYLNDIRHRTSCKYTHRPSTSKLVPQLTVTSPHSSSSPSHAPQQQCSTSSPAYAASPSSSSSSSYCSSSSPCSFTSLLSPSDSKDSLAHLIPRIPSSVTITAATSASTPPSSSSTLSCYSSPTSVESSVGGCGGGGGFGSINVASTAGSLDYIEPTIPLDTASTQHNQPKSDPTKVITSSKCKVSPRYHPYMYNGPHSTHGPMRQDSILNNYPCTFSQCGVSSSSSGCGAPLPPLYGSELPSPTTTDSREYCPAGAMASSQSYSCAGDDSTTVDTKTNPFRYPCVSSSHNSTVSSSTVEASSLSLNVNHNQQHQQLSHQHQEFTSLETPPLSASSCSVSVAYRESKMSSSRPPMSRYSPYATASHIRASTCGAATAQDVVVTLSSCGVDADAADVNGVDDCSSNQYSSCVSGVASSHHNPFFPPTCTTYSNL